MKNLHLTLAAMALCVVAPAHAKDSSKLDQAAARAALARGEILPIARILAIATDRVPGDVLKVKLERKPVGFQYEVKILAGNGRVREIELDARTGKILSIEDD